MATLQHRHPATPRGLFGKLPAELLVDILERLDYPSAMHLASANHTFRYAIQPLRHTSPSARACFLRYAEAYLAPDPRAVRACLKCFRIVRVEQMKRGPNVPMAWRCRKKLAVGMGGGKGLAMMPVCGECDGEAAQEDLDAYRISTDDIWDAPIKRCALCKRLRFPPCHMTCSRCGDCECLAEDSGACPEYFVEEAEGWCYQCGDATKCFKGRPRMDALEKVGWAKFEEIWERIGGLGRS